MQESVCSVISGRTSWATLHKKTYMEKEATISQIDHFMETHSFYKLKFISALEMMEFLKFSN